MNTADFQFAPMPHLHFGWGIRQQLIEHIQNQYQGAIVLITGRTLATPPQFGFQLQQGLLESNRRVSHFVVSGEPSPDLVDHIVQQCPKDAEVVIGLGGGSVLDAAKAIAGLIPSQTSVMDYLEGVGKGKPFNVETCPFIAVPTTAGTGSETTKNAVLSRLGEFKKSFRDNTLLAKEAWLDPELLKTCPQDVLYSTGLDAFTQLLESYTTLKPNPITDALAWKGMTLFKGAFELIASEDPRLQQQGYGNLMLAASLSGTTLANAGLGAVHGLAGPIGAFFEAPHGIVCAKLLEPITRRNIEALKEDSSASKQLKKFQEIGHLFCSKDNENISDESALTGLLEYLKQLTQTYAKQGLSEFGLTADKLKPVISNCRSGSMLGNPVTLSDDALLSAMLEAL